MPHHNLPTGNAATVIEAMQLEVRFAHQCGELRDKVNATAEALREQAAKGDYLAFQELYNVAFQYSQVLGELAENHPQAVGSFVARKTCWPVNAWPGTKFYENTKELLGTIKLGSALPFDLEKFARQDTVARTWIFNLIRRIDVLRHEQRAWRLIEMQTGETFGSTDFCIKISNLPELNSTTFRVWFEVAWQILMENTNKEPEKHVELRPLGIAGNITNSAAQEVPGVIRDNIKKRLLQTLKSVVRSS